MVAKVVAIASMKGGVGKTTMTLCVAEGSAAVMRKRVLVVDLDPQINASTLLTGALARHNVPWKQRMSIVEYLQGRMSRNDRSDLFIKKDLMEFNERGTVSLLSGNFTLRSFERALLARPGQTIRMAESAAREAINALLEEQKNSFDLVLFDCPPGFSLVTEAALAKADLIVLPTSPTHLGTQGLVAFVKYLEDELLIEAARDRVFVCMTMTGRTVTSRQFEQEVRNEQRNAEPKYRTFKATLPFRDGFQKAMDRREARMRVLGVLGRTLNKIRNKQLFDRLYDGVATEVKTVTDEMWKTLNAKGEQDEGFSGRDSSRSGRGAEARV
jgi:cellulose biosynthesis protein BcsQ